MNKAIDDETSGYNMVTNDSVMRRNDNISYSLLLEVILLRLRGETIKYSTIKKKKRLKKEEELIDEIAELEVNNIIDSNLENKRNELEKLREDKMYGVRIRSRANWLKDGEQASKFFCNLEKYNFTEKTIKKLKVENGTNIYDQKLILKEIKNFYEKLEKLEGKLTLTEISEALMRLKNEKSPGIDGFPSEFYKIFWAKLKYIILHALNESYDNGILSTTLRHGLITCLPKGQKPREFIKNWRPITLLSVVYKIASAAIANRLKPILEKNHTK